MARFVDAIDLPIPIEQAFDYLADFSRTAEWDPSVAEASRLTPGQIGIGSRFAVCVSLLGRRFPLEYSITGFDRPSRLVLKGGDDSLRSIDEITFVSRPGGTRVTYEARLELSGIRRIADPLLDLLFQGIGRLAARGLRERVAAESTSMRPHAEDAQRLAPAADRRGAEKGTRDLNEPHNTEGIAS